MLSYFNYVKNLVSDAISILLEMDQNSLEYSKIGSLNTKPKANYFFVNFNKQKNKLLNIN